MSGIITDRVGTFWNSSNKKLIYDVESRTSITPAKTAHLMYSLIDQKIREMRGICLERASILNMTGNYGGDTFPFLGTYDVTVYELDEKICRGLRSNIKQFQPASCRVVCGDSLLHLRYSDTEYDIILCDPPFGDDYKNEGKKYQPRIGSYSMSELLCEYSDRAKLFAFKLPRTNFDIEGFKKETKSLDMNVEYYTPSDLKDADPYHRQHKISFLMSWHRR